MKKIIVTGITGQDGSYMVEYLLNLEDTEVYGMVRRTAKIHDENFKHLLGNPRFKIVRGDLSDGPSLNTLVQQIGPDYFINFAAQSFVGDSWKIPYETFMSCAVGVLNCLEAIRNYQPSCRFYNAGSSEQFGDVIFSPQDETHPFRPRSPYGAAKCAAHHLVKVYRESYELYAVQGMLFNHESERRGEEFVTRKITKGIARITKAIHSGEGFTPIYLGNVDSKRDWSHAMDFMDAIWRMLNQDIYRHDVAEMVKDYDMSGKILLPRDINPTWRKILSKHLREYVVASGKENTVRDFIKVCTEQLGFDVSWRGSGDKERLVFNPSYVQKIGLKSDTLVKIDPEFYRPADVNSLLGKSSKISAELGWEPKISFDKLCKSMLLSDLHESGVATDFGYPKGT